MTTEETPSVGLAPWSSRIVTFSVSLLVVTLVLHRFVGLPTPLAINLFVTGLAGAGVGLLIGLAALTRIWFTGRAGAGAAAVGVLLGLAVLAGPAVSVVTHLDKPPINDLTTDLTNPPAFAALAKRPPGANPATYPGQPFADLQANAYPDLRTLVLDRPVEEAFKLVEEVVRRLRWRVVAEEPPMPPAADRATEPGIIEATEQTLMGFTDDIVIRVGGSATRARIDARSASRYGRADFGQNALRLRRLMAEIRARAEITPTAALVAKQRSHGAAARALIKRQKARDQQKAQSRNARAHGKSDVQRAPARRETPRL
ncbi:MAG: DUF1499 domain-containing protein [Hyphomicrobiaceae bacterium]|nr:DUF1499 domain-containing protein [Hyphomicrobiaceae bacterium]